MADIAVMSYPKTNTITDAATTSGFAFAAGTDFTVPATKKNIVFIINCTTGGTLTVKAGTGLAGTKDLALTLVANKSYAIQLDTNAYEDVEPTSANKGKILFSPTSNAAGSIIPVAAL